MAETLVSLAARFIQSQAELAEHIGGRPALVYEPRKLAVGDEDAEFGATRRLRTVSAVSSKAIGGGQPMVAFVGKSQTNAFQTRVTVGRTGNNDVVIDDPSVSRFHAWFEESQGHAWAIVDAGSKNGTAVAGKKLVPRRKADLTNGTRIQVGKVDLAFYTPDGLLQMLAERAQR